MTSLNAPAHSAIMEGIWLCHMDGLIKDVVEHYVIMVLLHVGRSLTSENGSYTSQFNITVSSEQLLAGGMIECLHDNGSHVFVVGAANITVTGAYMQCMCIAKSTN